MNKSRKISTRHPGVWQLGARSRIVALWYQLAVFGFALAVCLSHERSLPAAAVIACLILRDLVRLTLRWRRRLQPPLTPELLLPWMAWIVVDALAVLVVLPKLAPTLVADDQVLSLLALGYGLVVLLETATRMSLNGFTIPAGFMAICYLENPQAPGWLGTCTLFAIGVIFLAIARIVFLKATARLADQIAAAREQNLQRGEALMDCLIAVSNQPDTEQLAQAGRRIFETPWTMGALLGWLIPVLDKHGRTFVPSGLWTAEVNSHLAPATFDRFVAVVLEASQQDDGVEIGYPQLTWAGHALPIKIHRRHPHQPDLSAFADCVIPATGGWLLFLTGSTGGSYVSR